jgi:hypothetical protein
LKNVEIFNNITQHHRLLSDIVRNWETDEEEVLKDFNLISYASAATQMGDKSWVRNGNIWMQHAILDFSRLGRAKKLFIKQAKRAIYDGNRSLSLSVADIERSIAHLSDDLFVDSSKSLNEIQLSPLMMESKKNPYSFLTNMAPGTYRPIKVLDVGSCYNSIARGPYSSLFNVTALDLCPTDPSVLKCDFLRLSVGSSDSEMIVEHTDSRDKSSILLSLPSHSFDSVTMSLVLCYLPTPSSRLAMIRKARQLLVDGYTDSAVMIKKMVNCSMDKSDNNITNQKLLSSQPHRSGLLIIFEKQSVFPKGPMFQQFLNFTFL